MSRYWASRYFSLATGDGGGGDPAPVVLAGAYVVDNALTGVLYGWTKHLILGDARLTELATAPQLFLKNADDEIITGIGTKTFSDLDFNAKLRLAPLTPTTRYLDTVPSTIEISTADTPGIVWNDDTAGSEHFELQMTSAKTAIGVIRTVYSAQFIMNWGNGSTYETTINLGDITFIRKNGAAT